MILIKYLFNKYSNIIKIISIIIIVIILFIIINTNFNNGYIANTTNSFRDLHTTTTNSKGDTIYITKMEYYTKDNIRKSKDSVIINMLNELDNLKLRKIKNYITTDAHNTIEYRTIVYRDTVIIYNNKSTNISEYDAYNNGVLKIERFLIDSLTNIAHYKYEYKPTLYAAISWHKEGNWTINNIWNWRDKIWDINMTSNDSNLRFENTKFIYVGNKEY